MEPRAAGEWFHCQVLDILWRHFMVYKSIDHRKLPSICFLQKHGKSRSGIGNFFRWESARVTSDVIFIVCTLAEKLIATSQPARGNLDSYCKNVYWASWVSPILIYKSYHILNYQPNKSWILLNRLRNSIITSALVLEMPINDTNHQVLPKTTLICLIILKNLKYILQVWIVPICSSFCYWFCNFFSWHFKHKFCWNQNASDNTTVHQRPGILPDLWYCYAVKSGTNGLLMPRKCNGPKFKYICQQGTYAKIIISISNCFFTKRESQIWKFWPNFWPPTSCSANS